MKRKSIVLVLVALLAVGLAAPVVLAKKGQPVVIILRHPYHQECYAVGSHDQVVLLWGWLACSKGLVSDWLEAIDQHEYELNDQLLLGTGEANQQFGPIHEYSITFAPGYRCIWDAQHTARVLWEYELKQLQPGENVLHTHYTLAYEIIDGIEQCTNWHEGKEECIPDEWELLVYGPGFLPAVPVATTIIMVDEPCPTP